MDRTDAERTPESDEGDAARSSADVPVAVGRYTWREFLREHGHEAAAADLYEWIPDVPAVPASIVKTRVEDPATAVVRVDGVERPYRVDGETPVEGHGTPDAGTLVIGSDDVVVSGSAVVEDRQKSISEREAAEREKTEGEAAEREKAERESAERDVDQKAAEQDGEETESAEQEVQDTLANPVEQPDVTDSDADSAIEEHGGDPSATDPGSDDSVTGVDSESTNLFGVDQLDESATDDTDDPFGSAADDVDEDVANSADSADGADGEGTDRLAGDADADPDSDADRNGGRATADESGDANEDRDENEDRDADGNAMTDGGDDAIVDDDASSGTGHSDPDTTASDEADWRGVEAEIGPDGVPGLVVVDGADVEPVPARPPAPIDWERVPIDPATFLGFDPDELGYRLWAADAVGDTLWDLCHARYNLYEVPVLKGYYTWDDYVDQCYRDEAGELPTDEEDEPIPFTHEHKAAALGFNPDGIEDVLAAGADTAVQLSDLIDERTVNVNPDLDEDAFFSTADGETTLANRYDLEKAVPMAKKTHFREIERYWVNEPYAFVIVFRSTKENEVKYYAVQPYMTRIESDLAEFLTGKLRTSIKYADESIAGGDEAFREEVIADETRTLLDRYDLYEEDDEGLIVDLIDRLASRLDRDDDSGNRRFDLGRLGDRVGFNRVGLGSVDLDRVGLGSLHAGFETLRDRFTDAVDYEPPDQRAERPSGITARPEPAVLADDARTLSRYQVEKLLYYLKRDFIGYERIDPIKHDINVEDISCDGYESPVFVYHSEYEQIITNVYHETDELDDFVVKLAQRSGKGISKRRPQVDATLPDGSRAQLTLGKEVSDHGTNYTIRQFKDVPFTPVDLINWKTFSLDEMAFLWLCIENNKNLIFAGGTASGKTTSLNAVSLFIPSNAKIVSIEDTREVELPQRNWIASVTRPSFSDDDKGDVDEFDLLEAALRQRPDYIVMGEIRGEEGRTAFQVMSTGHTTYTTFHADSVGEVLKRFTTDPINVSKTMFTALDLVSIQSSTRVQGRKVRRNKSITEINHYDAENDEINVQDVYQWQAETDEFLQMGDSNTLEEIMFDRGWSRARLDEELRKRRLVLAYLIDRGLNSYAQVAATFQAFINDPETVLALMANDELERSLEDLREMESVLINVDPETEAMVPRPDPDEDGREEAKSILESADDLLADYRGSIPDSVAEALLDVDPVRDVEAHPDEDHATLAENAREADAFEVASQEDDPATDRIDEALRAGVSAAASTAAAVDAAVTSTRSDDDGMGVPGDVDVDASRNGSESPVSSAPTTADGGSGIDFDRPFDEPSDGAVDVMWPPSEGDSKGDGPDPNGRGERTDVGNGGDEIDHADSEDIADDDTEEGDGDSAGMDDDTEEGDGEDIAVGTGTDGSEDTETDIDEWGFETVEPAEEEG